MFFFKCKKKNDSLKSYLFRYFISERSKVSAHSVKALALLEARRELLVTVLLLEDDDLIINSISI